MHQNVWEQLFTRLQPEPEPLHERFLQVMADLQAMNEEETITDEELDLIVHQLVAAVLARKVDSMVTGLFFSIPGHHAWPDAHSSPLAGTRGSAPLIPQRYGSSR